MNISRILICTLLIGLLSACTRVMFKKPPYNTPSDDASIKLAEAAYSVSDSMLKMARIEKVVTPPHADNLQTIPNAHNLQIRASIDWSGPIAELTEQVSRVAGYKLRILGQPPSMPILISLDVQNESLAEILRDIDYQAGQKATLHVYPKHHVIELRYAKIYS